MNRWTMPLLLVLCGCTGALPTVAGATNAQERADGHLTILAGPPQRAEPFFDNFGAPAVITPSGYNAISIGARLAELQERYELHTANAEHFDDSCRLYATTLLPGLLVYVQDGLVTRVSFSHVRLAAYVWVPLVVRTDRGIAIGASGEELRRAYPGLRALRSRSEEATELYSGGAEGGPGCASTWDPTAASARFPPASCPRCNFARAASSHAVRTTWVPAAHVGGDLP